jgi:hypothetical protein
MKPFTHAVVMVRPAAFGFNEETSFNNFFQDSSQKNNTQLQALALEQFEEMVQLLRSHEIEVLVLNDTPFPEKPDAVFPNNWFCCNHGVISIFPMCAQNRRPEKRPELVEAIKKITGIPLVNDWSFYEEDKLFLEGTGSMVFDHEARIIYACVSVRTHEKLFYQFCSQLNFTPILFSAADEKGNEIYHTNVMMCVGNGFAVVCLDAITNVIERKIVVHELDTTGHEIIEISFEQLPHFAGNMLQLITKKEEPLLVMSSTAYHSLSAGQLERIKKYTTIITPNVSHIEKASGGSVRCMMAELFF